MSENKYNIKVGIYNGGRAEWSEAPDDNLRCMGL